jgi:hypothetical protein
VDIFCSFVSAIDGVSPTITNENVTDIGLLCDEFGHERLSKTVIEFLAQNSSPGEPACREIIALEAQNATLADQFARLETKNFDLVTRVADLTAQNSREIVSLQAIAFKLFGAERFLVETSKVALETSADQLGKPCPEMIWNKESDRIQKWAPALPVDEVFAMVQRRFPNIKVRRFPPSVRKMITTNVRGSSTIGIDMPDGIIGHLTRECGGNVHDRHVVDVTSGSFERETEGSNRPSGTYRNDPDYMGKNAADFEAVLWFR